MEINWEFIIRIMPLILGSVLLLVVMLISASFVSKRYPNRVFAKLLCDVLLAIGYIPFSLLMLVVVLNLFMQFGIMAFCGVVGCGE